jgi:hypothetical protein
MNLCKHESGRRSDHELCGSVPLWEKKYYSHGVTKARRKNRGLGTSGDTFFRSSAARDGRGNEFLDDQCCISTLIATSDGQLWSQRT